MNKSRSSEESSETKARESADTTPGERSRPLATEEVLRHAIEIAEALSEAHRSSFTSGALSSWSHRLARSLEASASRNPYQYRCARRSVEAATFYGPAGYDVSLDGQRLLIVQEAEEESAPRQIHVVLNWHEELKRRVPTR